MRTARRLGIGTVAVYSEADAGALHVRMADEAVAIGGSAPSESYLVGPRIIRAALDTGAEAIHPGFGFLSENAGFVEAVEEAGLVFIGPGAAAIAAMGDKIESKRLAERAGVPVVPGDAGEIADAEAAVASAGRIGYPVMVKASAGGGGKGMRIARSDEELRQVFGSTVNEAENAFGDGRVFVEKYVEEPRHIEIQVLADAHGNAVHLGERECSIQRRHQKVIEECPSPFVDAALRQENGRARGCARPRRRLPLGRHGRVHRGPGAQFLFPGDEHPPPGRTPRDRDGDRPRPRGADAARGGRRAARLRPAGCPPRRLGHRGAGLCGAAGA